MSRYNNRNIGVNREQSYDKVFKKRGVKRITQYTTPTLPRPTQEQLDKLKYTIYTWSAGDRYWRIAERAYGDKDLWVIIAKFNNKPTEAHIKVGDEIKIPTDIAQAVQILGY